MRLSCLINNYNYGEFVIEAVESALAQERPLDEIIVIDDGSKDDSRRLLEQRYGKHPVVRLIFKANGGQLSCFNEGFAAATGDIIFFLDADDTWEPGYTKTVCATYETTSADFVFTAHRKFGAVNEAVDAGPDRDFGYTRIYTYFLRKWIGAPTSCLSMRREVLAAFLPIPFFQDWRVRADDCLVFGASLVGARKWRIGQPLVNYRIHNRNNFHGRGEDRLRTYHNELATQRFFDYVAAQQQINLSAVPHLAWLEFCCKPQPTSEEFRHYLRIFMRNDVFDLARKLRYAMRMWKHLRDSARNHPQKSSASGQSSQVRSV